jgi:hypothetical protein
MKWLHGAESELTKVWESQLTERGEEMRGWAMKKYRTGYGSATRTASRYGNLHNAYGAKVVMGKIKRDGLIQLQYGGVKPNTDAKTLKSLRIQEGYNYAGQKVSSFKIAPKAGGKGYLTFPIMAKGGGTKIVGWVTTRKTITLKPRPTFPFVDEKYAPILAKDLARSAARAWSAAA